MRVVGGGVEEPAEFGRGPGHAGLTVVAAVLPDSSRLAGKLGGDWRPGRRSGNLGRLWTSS
ncbi:MAG: hypothetical protein M3O70_26130 [Actinomycetota bacterium]|nr:hypothetical protein [Actinomycetota bacterium]